MATNMVGYARDYMMKHDTFVPRILKLDADVQPIDALLQRPGS